MKIMLAVIFFVVYAGVCSAEVNRTACERRLAGYSFAKLIERSLENKKLTVRQVAPLVEAEAPFNPLDGASLGSGNLALHSVLASYLPMSTQEWAVEKEEIRATLKKVQQLQGLVEEAAVKTEELIAPKLIGSQELTGSDLGAGKWFNTKAGQIILGYQNESGFMEARDLLTGKPIWTSAEKVSDDEHWNFAEIADGKAGIHFLSEVQRGKILGLFQLPPQKASARKVDLATGAVTSREVRQLGRFGPFGDNRYYYDDQTIEVLRQENFVLGNGSFFLPVLAASEPVIAVNDLRRDVGESRFFFYKFQNGEIKKLNKEPMTRNGYAVYAESVALPDGSSSFVIFSMIDKEITFLPPFRDQVSKPVELLRPPPIWVGPRVPHGGSLECKNTGAKMFVTTDSRILVAIAMVCRGEPRLQVFEPLVSTEPVFDQSFERGGGKIANLTWFERKGRSYLVNDFAGEDTYVLEPLYSQSPVARFSLVKNGNQNLKIFKGPAGQVYLVSFTAMQMTREKYKNTVSVFTLFNKVDR